MGYVQLSWKSLKHADCTCMYKVWSKVVRKVVNAFNQIKKYHYPVDISIQSLNNWRLYKIRANITPTYITTFLLAKNNRISCDIDNNHYAGKSSSFMQCLFQFFWTLSYFHSNSPLGIIRLGVSKYFKQRRLRNECTTMFKFLSDVRDPFGVLFPNVCEGRTVYPRCCN